MNALLQKKREWEYQNQQVLLRLVQTSSDVSVESVKKAGLLTSFLLYVIYALIRGMLATGAALFQEPQLVRQIAPQSRPLESHEFNREQLAAQLETLRPRR